MPPACYGVWALPVMVMSELITWTANSFCWTEEPSLVHFANQDNGLGLITQIISVSEGVQ